MLFLKGRKYHRHSRKKEAMNNSITVYLIDYFFVFTSASEEWKVNDTWERSEITVIATLSHFHASKFVK